ncbi:acetyl/propionyl-CoA carboxylase subunit alpha [Salinibacterium sp. SYSU T00001]|uniref:ATP-binding protein n=1 Tax=Homoserinimonas sedimenticola TaxID=2986805 RepID=UPI002236016E|nr:acetyl/propionyl-CoA carboxylase subunit alpha [Salinibacterium sedimenticola]
MPLFESVLVANRGEIACRIIRTLRRLGIRSIAVYSFADADAPHTRLADVAVRIGPPPARESYLDVAAIVRAARETGAAAVHPGYGFLSESTALAEACAEAGIVFVGPPVAAIDLMGDKIRAKNHVAEQGVPVIPGVSKPGLDDKALAAAAESVGFPLLVKPSAGGGGKGMQVVDAAAELPPALATARRVARSAFGDDELLLERLIPSPRHIEVQVLADSHGAVVHLGERECSLQRRHQKVIEEAPSPLLDAATRERMGEAACAVARGAGYVGAGTVEFLVSGDDPDSFYFMEMNARLQVEHPVTEEVVEAAGRRIDLVEQQLRIAAGEPLSFAQSDVALVGHAIEARVYAEDPARDFLPATGRVLELALPNGVRVDAGIERGSRVTSDYDPMLAKVIARGADRAEALSNLDRALAETVVLGVAHNVGFLRQLLATEEVRSGALDTGVIERMLRHAAPVTVEQQALQVAALEFHADATPGTGPWHAGDGWRLGEHRPARYVLEVHGERHTVEVPNAPPRHRYRVARDGDSVWIGRDGASVALRFIPRDELLAEKLAAIGRAEGEASPELRSPMPGTVVAVGASTGDEVAAGQVVVTIEAMKMEHHLTAGSDGVVTVHVREGDLAQLGQVVAAIAPRHNEEKKQ